MAKNFHTLNIQLKLYRKRPHCVPESNSQEERGSFNQKNPEETNPKKLVDPGVLVKKRFFLILK